MTAQLVKNMSDSDLLDMHYFLTEDEYFDGEVQRQYSTAPLPCIR